MTWTESVREALPDLRANLTDDMVDVLNVWARFIYGPLMDDRVRSELEIGDDEIDIPEFLKE